MNGDDRTVPLQVSDNRVDVSLQTVGDILAQLWNAKKAPPVGCELHRAEEIVRMVPI